MLPLFSLYGQRRVSCQNSPQFSPFYSNLCQPILPILTPHVFYRTQSRILIHRDFPVSKQFNSLQRFLAASFFIFTSHLKNPFITINMNALLKIESFRENSRNSRQKAFAKVAMSQSPKENSCILYALHVKNPNAYCYCRKI